MDLIRQSRRDPQSTRRRPARPGTKASAAAGELVFLTGDDAPADGGSFESLIVFIERETPAAFVRTLPARGVREALDSLEPDSAAPGRRDP